MKVFDLVISPVIRKSSCPLRRRRVSTVRYSSRARRRAIAAAAFIISGLVGISITAAESASAATDALTVSGPATPGYAENGTAAVGTYTASGATGTVTWSLSGDDSGYFSISSTGELSFGSPPDYEGPDDADTDNEYLVTVEASDGTETGSLEVAVTVTDVPVVSGTATLDYVENGTDDVGTYTASGASGTVTWGLSGDDSGVLSIDSSTGVLSFGSSPDYDSPGDADTDNEYLVTVEASDGTETGSLAVAVTVTGVDEWPVLSGPAMFDHAENSPDGAAVGTYTATDPEGATIVWRLSGDDSNNLNIVVETVDGVVHGVLSFGSPPNFEDPRDDDRDNKYEVTVEAADDGNKTSFLDVIVTVTDVDEVPVVSGTATLNYVENGTVAVGTYTAIDPEGATITWSLEQVDDYGDFSIDSSIDSSMGVLSFVGSPDYEGPDDADTDNVYAVTVEASDGTVTGSLAVAVTVTDVPVVSGTATLDYAENGTDAVGTYTASGASGTVTWSLSGDDSGYFSISSTGELSFGSPPDYKFSPDYESPADNNTDNEYLVTVEASDGTETGRLAVAVTVTDVDEAPVISGAEELDHAENGPDGAPVGTYTAIDPEGASIWWSISGGDDSEEFSIVDGVLAFDVSRDYESPDDADTDNEYLVMVQAADGPYNDGDRKISRLDVAVTVTDVPVVSGTATLDYAENGTAAVGTYTASGASGTVTWSLSGDDSGDFSISSMGELSFGSSPDYSPDYEGPADADTDNEYLVTVEASDGTETGRLAVAVTVTDVDEAPVISGAEELDHAENSPDGAAVGTYTAIDPEGASIWWSLSGGDDSAEFVIVAGVLVFNVSRDYESPDDYDTDNEYLVEVQAADGPYNDGDRKISSLEVAVTVTDVPVVSGTATLDYAENGTAAVGTYTASGASGTVTWSLSGDDSGDFSISSMGELSFGSSPDYSPDYEGPADADTDNEYLVTVEASDGTEIGSLAVAVTVTDVPVVSGTATLDYAENGTDAVGTYTASGASGTVTWSLSGDDSGYFSISSTGELSFGSPPEYEFSPDYESPADNNTDNVYAVTVEASDGTETGRLAVAVTVTDVDEAPVISGEGALDYAENGTDAVGTYTATDPEDPDAIIVWSLSGDDSGDFSISSMGELSFGSSPDYSPDYEGPDDADTDNVYAVTVEASDGTVTGSLAVAVTVTDVPVVSGTATLDYAENGTVAVGTYTASGASGTVTWSLSGDDYGVFSIDSSTGVLSFGSSPDYSPDYEGPADGDTDNEYLVTVEASDGTETGRLAVAVTVTDVDEAPVISGATAPDYAENGTVAVGTYTAIDPEGATITWSLSGDDSGDFSISSMGVLSFVGSPDFEGPADADTDNEYQVMVQASDGPITDEDRKTGSLDVTVTVTDEPASPRNLSATPGDGQVELAWDDPGDDTITKYQLWQYARSANLTAANSDKFGHSVAVVGDTAVVGTPGDDETHEDSGSVFVFTRDSDSGVWTQAAKLKASDAAAYDEFGTSVAFDGSTIVVGAYGDDDKGDDSGSAYVFTMPGTGWTDGTETAKLIASDGAPSDEFGRNAVAVDGDTVVVGAYAHDTNAGKAYVFSKPTSAGGWDDWDTNQDTETAKLTAANAESGDEFGNSVAVDGDTIVVGASGDDGTSLQFKGSAFVFVKPAGGWASTSTAAKLTASNRGNNDYFGRSVAIDGNTVVVGAYKHDSARGSAFVFVEPSGGWADNTETAKLVASDRAANDRFGFSVAVDGNSVVVGAYGNDGSRGSAYVFTKPGTAWAHGSEAAQLVASERSINDRFGHSVTIDGDTVVVGAVNEAAAHVFGISGWTDIAGAGATSHTVTGLTNDIEYAFRIRAVSTAEAGAASESVDAKTVPVPEAPTGLAATPGDGQVVLTWDDPDNDTITKYQYSPDGGTNFVDIDGSDESTTTVTVTGLTNGTTHTLAVRAVNDSGVGVVSTVTAVMVPAAAVNLSAAPGDGQVALSWDDPDDGDTITKYQLWRRYAETAKLVEGSGGAQYEEFGNAVAVDGDMAVIGAPKDINSSVQTGAVFVFSRDPDTGVWSRQAKLEASGGEANDSFGISVALDGDTIVVGVLLDDLTAAETGTNDMASAGSAYVFTMPAGGWGEWASLTNNAKAALTAKFIASDAAPGDEFGNAVAVDDVTGTIVVGAWRDDANDDDIDDTNDVSDSGSAYVFARDSNGGWSQAAKLTASVPEVNDYFGRSVAVDGVAVLTGASGIDSTDDNDDEVADSGAAYVFTEPAGGWTNTDTTNATKLSASDGAANDFFGTSVALDGGTAAIGAGGDDSNKGSAYVFVRESGVWGEKAKLIASDRDDDGRGSEFGNSVAVDGDTVVVGADGVDQSNAVTNSGAAYVFTKPASGWADSSEAAKLTASDGESNDKFGGAVAIDGDTVMVGANDANSDRGAAYVFGDWTDVPGSSEETTSHTVTGLTNDTEYWFRVRAVNASGAGPASDTVSATPIPPPAKPTGLSAAPGNARALLRWDDPGNSSITKYQLWQIAESAKLVDSDGGQDDEFGNAIAVDGDTAVIGAPRDDDKGLGSGSAFVFTRDSEGDWSRVAQLALSGNNRLNFRFGTSVALDGNTIVVGAPYANSSKGTAYVFTKPNGGWTGTISTGDAAKLTASDGSALDEFGRSVAVDDAAGTIVVGAEADGTYTGSAYVFTKPAAGWATGDETAKLTASDPATNRFFGRSVAVQGDTVLIGADKATGDVGGSGAAYLFTKPAAGWATGDETAKLTASDGMADDQFGISVAMDGETAVIGAIGDDGSRGSAYVFTKPAGGWATGDETAKLTASDRAGGDNFGNSVAVDGDTVVVGAKADGGNKGSAYVFIKLATGWASRNEWVKLTASDGGTNERFGASVAIDRDVVMVGADGADGAGNSNEGAAYVFGDWIDIAQSGATTTSHTVTGLTNYTEYWFRIRAINDSGGGAPSDLVSATPRPPKPAKPTGLSAQAGDAEVSLGWTNPADSTIDKYQISEVIQDRRLTASDGAAYDQLGISVAVDGDTAVVGAYQGYNTGGTGAGAAYVFVRDSSGAWSQAAKLTAGDGAEDDRFGYAVALDGNTIVVSAYRDDDDGDDSGSAYVFVKPNTGWATDTETVKLTASDGGVDDLFGVSVAVDGDTVVVGAPYQDSPGGLVAVGSVYVFTKPTSAGGWADASDETAKLTAPNGLPNDRFGFSVAVDGDTVLIGSHSSDDGFGRDGHGRAYVFTKPATGWTTTSTPTVKLTASDGAPGDWFGYSVALDGDTAVIGARLHNVSGVGAGAGSAYVFTRISGVWGEKAKLAASDGAARDNFGVSVAVEGDTALVGAWLDDANGSRSGSVYVFAKPDLGWATTFETVKLTASDGATNDRFGASVAVGKITVNSEIRSLAVVGAYKDDTDAGADSGSVYVLGISDWTDIPGSVAATVSHTMAGLTNGIEYTFQIRALNESGAGPASDGASATPMPKPLKPTGFAATAGDTQVRLGWANPNDSSITKYEFQRSGSDGSFVGWADIPGSGPTTITYTFTGLTNTVEYTFQVRAVNVIGESPASDSRSATPMSSSPDKPTGLSADPGDTQVKLAWDDPDDSSITKYQYQKTPSDDPTAWIDVPGSGAATTTYSVTGLTNDVEYTFQISAVDRVAKSEDSEGASATPTSSKPAPPTGLRADPSDSRVTLTWDDPDDSSITKYQYQKTPSDDPTAWIDVPRSGATTTIYTVTGLTNGVEYTFQIRAVDEDDESDPSGDVTVTPPPAPAQPTGFRAVAGNQRVRLSWKDPNNPTITKYEVLRLLDPSDLTPSGVVADDYFGYSVAVDGDIAVIGAYGDDGAGIDSGAAYVFTKVSDRWIRTAKLTASDGAAYDNFGVSVAVDGDIAVIGAYGDDGAGIDSGAAYVFARDSGTWSQAAKLTASDGAALDYFGYSVAVDGDTVLVGAYQDDDEDDDLEDSGSVYVFVEPGAGWGTGTETAKLTASGGGEDDYFGISVAVDGDTAVIGASGDDDNGADSGSVYVFIRVSGTWSQQTKLTASDGAAYDWFGYAVAVDGDTVVVGAYGDDDNGPASGSAYVFIRVSGTWSQQTKLTASDGAAYDWFGHSVAVDGDTAVVGAYGDDDNGPASGSAYVFIRVSGTWSQTVKLTASEGAADDWFGYSVAVDGDFPVVGAGSAYVSGVRDWVDVSGSNAGTTTYTETGLTNGVDYTFQIRAVNLAGESPETPRSSSTPRGGAGFVGSPDRSNDNDDPSFVDGDSVTLTVAENTTVGGDVGEVAATDPDDDTLTYSLSWTDASYFDIATSTGQIIVGSGTVLDYESDTTSYTVIVFVHDGKDLDGDADSEIDDSIDVTISVTDVDEAPILTGPRSVSYPENATVPVAVYEASDPESATISWSLSGDDSGDFIMAGGVLRFDASPNYESPADRDTDNDHEVTVKASDGSTSAATLEVTVTVTDVNEAPVATDDTLTVAEDASATTLDVVANDSDADGDLLSVAAVGTASEGIAVIKQGSATEITYTPNSNFDGSDSFTYVVSDGNGGTDTGTVNVTTTPRSLEPANDSPWFDEGASTTRTVAENAAVGTEVGNPVTARDGDNDRLAYSLLGTDRAFFDVDRTTAQLTTKALFDHEVQNEYSVQVRAQDGQGGADVIGVTITVVDVAEPPAQPGAPDISSTGSTGLIVGWSAPDNQGPEITDYDVQYREASGEFQDAGHNGSGTSMTLNDLKPGTGYEVQVRAVNAEGTSPWSESGRGETEEAPPTPAPTPSPEPTPAPSPEPAPALSSEPTPAPSPEPTPAPAPTVEPTPSDTDSGDGGFPWWIIVVVVIGVAVGIVVGVRRRRR